MRVEHVETKMRSLLDAAAHNLRTRRLMLNWEQGLMKSLKTKRLQTKEMATRRQQCHAARGAYNADVSTGQNCRGHPKAARASVDRLRHVEEDIDLIACDVILRKLEDVGLHNILLTHSQAPESVNFGLLPRQRSDIFMIFQKSPCFFTHLNFFSFLISFWRSFFGFFSARVVSSRTS